MTSDPPAPGEHTFAPSASSTVAQLSYTVIPSKRGDDYAPIMIICAVGWGPGRGPATESIAPLFISHFTVVTASPRGSDQSSPLVDEDGSPDPNKMGSVMMADDLESLRVHLGLSSIPVLVGHSNGGAICLAFAEKYPENVNKLLLIGGQLIGYNNAPVFGRFREERQGLPQYKEAYENWPEYMSAQTDDEFRERLLILLPAFFLDPVKHCSAYASAIKRCQPKVWNARSQEAADKEYAKTRDANGETEIMSNLHRVKAKTLCSYGVADIVCAVESGQMIINRLKSAGTQAELHVYEASGHLPWIEQEKEFIDRTLEFLGV